MTNDSNSEDSTWHELRNSQPEPDPARHPRVTVDMERLALTVHGDYPYEIDLERCSTAARLLDAVLQVSRKPWCDRTLAGELLAAVDSACRMHFGKTTQGMFCPWGESQTVAWGDRTEWQEANRRGVPPRPA